MQAIFNELLELPKDTEIELVRAHRALNPRPSDTAPPRDIICCLQSFTLKEEILGKSRRNDKILFNDQPASLFQDLSHITLKNRRALRPLLEVLRERGIPYRLKFPFTFNATYKGKQCYLHMPEDIAIFCIQLNLLLIDLPEWYQEFRVPTFGNTPPHSLQASPSKPPSSKKSKLNKRSDPHYGKPQYAPGGLRSEEYT